MFKSCCQCVLLLLLMGQSLRAAESNSMPERPTSWVIIRSSVTATFKRRTTTALNRLPKSIRHLLRTKGWRVIAARLVIDAAPELRGKVPRGWPNGTTWSNSDAVHLPQRKTIIIAEKRYSRAGLVVNVRRVGGVLRHEIGHAFDMALETKSKKQTRRTFHSSSTEFAGVYSTDIAHMSREGKRQLKYFVQTGPAGRQETFAEAFAILLGGGSVPAREKIFRTAFPRVVDYVQGKMSAIRP